jgi:WD40 repeat protein
MEVACNFFKELSFIGQQMKVSGHGEMQLYWVGTNTLAVMGKDPYIRLWDVETNYNTVLEAKRTEVGDDESFLSIDYHPIDGKLNVDVS